MKRTLGTAACLIVAALALSVVIVGLLGVVAGCAKAALTAVDAGNLGVCILNHSTEPPAQIAHECGDLEIKVVEDILAAHRAAAEREAKAGAK